MRFKLILSSVKPDLTDHIVDSAKEAGATGATIIPARGTGLKEAKTFFGLSLEAQTDIIMFLVEEHFVAKILDAIKKAGKFHEPGTGIAFVLPVEHVIGLESQMEKFKEEVRNSYL
ncbi:P-II family nitrogen regulator [Desulforhopalus vacuolatus]|uniref:P-II family nitrogen regulator n=1 Tax=Desulforhopalus vacuolatus TaxID=40414 RepID=UPI001966128D|nr:P-II family nitrogen regulator [Desulforhopalus vacuolatus]MBM9519599.1 P-II family nitrogen regulator [Desulforhopalus vacuolatus]